MKPEINSYRQDRKSLLSWYDKHKRDLPWRKKKDAYLIWISEVMLQQTTVTAVIPFYEKFIRNFPTINHLAESTIDEVYKYWSGLGYYSRARNLHKTAQIVTENFDGSFPKKHEELIQLPGLGPYTSRAIASIAYDQQVGVLDGNVIRILTRKYGLELDWWNNKEKSTLQEIADNLASDPNAADINQAMMELGATICTPKKALCSLCPWVKSCDSFKKDLIQLRPKAKPRKKNEIWQWDLDVKIHQNKILLSPNSNAPFLKNMWLPQGNAKKLSKKPDYYNFKHNITKYEIYTLIKLSRPSASELKSEKSQHKWVNIDRISEVNPTSYMKKILKVHKEV